MTEVRNEPSGMNTFAVFTTLFHRDLLLAFRSPGQMINPLAFFLMVSSLFPLGISPDQQTLAELSGGILWIGALLAVLLSLDSLFKADQDDGALDYLLMSPHPLPLLVLAKVSCHWVTTGLCLTIMAPVCALMLHMPEEAITALVLSLLVGTPVLSLVGGIGAALTVRLSRGGVLLTLISLPLYIPTLIFGTGAVRAASSQLPYTGHILWLLVFLVFGLCMAPLAIAGALRVVSDG